MTIEEKETIILAGGDVVLPPSAGSLRSLMNHPSTTCPSSDNADNGNLRKRDEEEETKSKGEANRGNEGNDPYRGGRGDSWSSLSSASDDEHDDDASTVILNHGANGEDKNTPDLKPSSLSSSSTTPTDDILSPIWKHKKSQSLSTFHPTTTSTDVSAYKAHIQNLQKRVKTSQSALQNSEQQLKQAQDQVATLTNKCAELEAATLPQSNNNNVSDPNREMVERLRAKNVALIEQCSLLQTMSDKDAVIINHLRASYAQLSHQKMEMEVEFCNQLSSLSESIKSSEDDHTEQLKAKRDTIASLKAHVHNQDNSILRLQEEVYELKEAMLNRSKFDSISSTESEEESRRSGSNSIKEPSSMVLILEQEKKLLLERVEFLTLNRASLTEEVDELRDRAAGLSQLETKVIPQLKEQLEATRDELKSLEQELQMILKNNASAAEELQNSLMASEMEKTQLEEDFIQQIIQLNKQKKTIVLDYQSESEEKDVIIKKFEKQNASLREKIVQLQSQSELEEITGNEEVERLLQMNMVTEEKLSEQDATIQELKFSIREEKKLNAYLTKELKKYRSAERS